MDAKRMTSCKKNCAHIMLTNNISDDTHTFTHAQTKIVSAHIKKNVNNKNCSRTE